MSRDSPNDSPRSRFCSDHFSRYDSRFGNIICHVPCERKISFFLRGKNASITQLADFIIAETLKNQIKRRFYERWMTQI